MIVLDNMQKILKFMVKLKVIVNYVKNNVTIALTIINVNSVLLYIENFKIKIKFF